ncbi:MAG: hypothetical protein ACR2JK_01455 [Geodermatophilaceae bacterium]
MRSSARRSPRRERSSNALSVIGNLLLVLATLAVAALVAYLVLYPPGALKAVSQETQTTTTPPPTTSSAPPATSTAPAALSLTAACGGVAPTLDQTDAVVTTAANDPAALNSETIAGVSRDLQTSSGTAPSELKALIDPLAAQLVELNNAVLAGEEAPDFDAEGATAKTEAIRTLCAG